MAWVLPPRRLAVDTTGMRRFLAVCLIVVACTSNTSTTTTIGIIPPPPDPVGPATTTTGPPPTTTQPVRNTYEGAFPDGTSYTVLVDGADQEEVTGIGGVVMFESRNGPIPAADTLISLTNIAGYSYDDGLYRAQGGGAGGFVLDFYDSVLAELGPDAEMLIRRSIKGWSSSGLPVLGLEEPFRWATPEDGLTVPMQVKYSTFVVRKGCHDLAVACSRFHGVQVIPSGSLFSPAPPFDAVDVFINSSAPRLSSDPSYMDIGPLPTLDNPDVLWTGEELILWNPNISGRGNPGAAFDPDSNEWRTFNGPELAEGTTSRALWTGEQLLVVTRFGTYAGDPVDDSWSQIATGLPHAQPFGSAVVIEGQPHLWPAGGIVTLDIETGEWVDLPDPGFGVGADPWRGMLHDFGGNLVAIGIFNGNHQSRRTALWTGSEWTDLPRVTFSSFSTANQSMVVGGELILWSGRRDPTFRYNAGSLMWEHDESFPRRDGDAPMGALLLDHRALVSGSPAALYDASTRSWSAVEIPGITTGVGQMVWTGSEVLAWTNGDAWRWTPPESG